METLDLRSLRKYTDIVSRELPPLVSFDRLRTSGDSSSPLMVSLSNHMGEEELSVT